MLPIFTVNWLGFSDGVSGEFGVGFFGWFSFNLLELLEEKKHFTFYGLWNLHLLNYFYYLFVWSFFPIHYLSAFCNYKYFTPSFKKDVPNGVNIRTTILFSAR